MKQTHCYILGFALIAWIWILTSMIKRQNELIERQQNLIDSKNRKISKLTNRNDSLTVVLILMGEKSNSYMLK